VVPFSRAVDAYPRDHGHFSESYKARYLGRQNMRFVDLRDSHAVLSALTSALYWALRSGTPAQHAIRKQLGS